MKQGWVCVHRSVLDHWVHKDLAQFGAWIDLLLMANHESNKMVLNGEIIIIERGQLFTSNRSLSQKWGWSKDKINRFLTLLERDGMLSRKCDTNGTLLTIVNYGVYQDVVSENETPMRHQRDTDETRIGRNNNNNNDNNDNNIKTYVGQISEVLNYLNIRTGKKYTGRSEANKKHIIARLKEGFTVEEFKRVIDNKVNAWGQDSKMKQYLRPETLFGTKFETYLNDTEDKQQRARREEYEFHEKQRQAIQEAADFDVGFLK